MRLTFNRSHQSPPEGGWSYPTEEGPTLSSPKIGGPGLDDLLGQIKVYRESNGIPLGDPEHDLAVHYMSICPWLIDYHDDEPAVKSTGPEPWVHRAWASFPIQMAETRAIDERFTKCVGCDNFKPIDYDSISNEGARRLLIMNPAKQRSEHGWCSLRQWVCSVAVQVQDPSILAASKQKEDCCWL